MKRDRPIMVYDGECRFCRRMIARLRKMTSNQIDYRSYQRVAHEFSQVSVQDFEKAVYWFDPGGRFLWGSDAVLRCLSYIPHLRWLVYLYDRSGIFRWMGRAVYSCVARNRSVFSRIFKFLRWI